MASRIGVFATSVGTKILIGLSGLFLVFYLLIHIGGNLVVFAGPAAYNKYAFTLEHNKALLYPLEVIILAGFLTHIYKTVTMFLANQQARPVAYVQKKRAGKPSRKTLASSTMIASGLWLIVFLVFHVKAFREGWGSNEYEWAAGGRDLYRQEMEIFSSPLLVGFYILSMIVVGSHLWHGVSSAFQSLGLDHPAVTPRLITAGKVLALLIAGGFIVIAAWAYLTQGGRA
ncbi:MAG TPA: succinate dehydrogenase cytochrome b subunit [Vicinamibacterales bacterium]|nr:succinate dehydrogenase cytochrome b subunit [Vicinamibacterales bacterium]